MKRLFRVYSKTRKTHKEMFLTNDEVLEKLNDGYFVILATENKSDDKYKLSDKDTCKQVTREYEHYDYQKEWSHIPIYRESSKKMYAI